MAPNLQAVPGSLPASPLWVLEEGALRGDLRGWLTHPLRPGNPGQAAGSLRGGRDMVVQGERLYGDRRARGDGQRVPAGVTQGARWSWRGVSPSGHPGISTQPLLGPRGPPEPLSLALQCPCTPQFAQFSVGCPAGGDVAGGVLPPAGSGCPSSVAPGTQSVAAAISASLAEGLGDSGASRL